MKFGKGEGTKQTSSFSSIFFCWTCLWNEKGIICVKARKVEEAMMSVTTGERGTLRQLLVLVLLVDIGKSKTSSIDSSNVWTDLEEDGSMVCIPRFPQLSLSEGNWIIQFGRAWRKAQGRGTIWTLLEPGMDICGSEDVGYHPRAKYLIPTSSSSATGMRL